MLAYLHGWAVELVGRSGLTMGGVAPVSHMEIQAWSALSGHVPTVLELEAIRRIDAVIRNPEPPKSEDDAPALTEPRVVKAWPTRKANG